MTILIELQTCNHRRRNILRIKMPFLIRLALIVLMIVFVYVTSIAATVSDKLVKCCENDFIVSENEEKCVPSHLNNGTYYRILQASGLTFDSNRDGYSTCFEGISNSSYIGNTPNASSFTSSCLDLLTNNSIVYLNCSTIFQNLKNDQCDSILKIVKIYGASQSIIINIIFVLMYLFVCLVYAFKPKICRRAYDKAVLLYVISQILTCFLVIFVGHHFLCHKTLSNLTCSIIGLSLMILTINTCLWLLIMSFDVASTITRISCEKNNENHKFYVYLLWVSIGTIIPGTVSTILEFLPLPEDHILKPQFWRMTSVNYRVIAHVAYIPALVCIASNTLFFYTTWKMICISRSTKLANQNRKSKIRLRYFFYLKLYLFMDANYVTGALGAMFENLWFFHFSRLIQTMLMLLAVLPRETS